MTALPPPDEGWYWPANARKAHYYVEGRSLCGKWGVLAAFMLTARRAARPGDCVGCRRALDRRQGMA